MDSIMYFRSFSLNIGGFCPNNRIKSREISQTNLQLSDSGVGAKTHVDVAVLRGGLEELNVASMKEVKTPGYHYSLSSILVSCVMDSLKQSKSHRNIGSNLHAQTLPAAGQRTQESSAFVLVFPTW